MSILYLLIPLGLIMLVIGIAAFFWATRSGQFDDLDAPAWSVVMDDDSKPRDTAKKAGGEEGQE